MHRFKSISEFKLELQSGNTQLGVEIDNTLSRGALKFDEWPWKTIGHLFYTTSSFVHHFKSIVEIKLELQSENAQFRSKLIFVPRDLEIWRITLKYNKAPFLYYIELCASFQSHEGIQTGVTVRKRPIRVKIGNFLSCVTLKFVRWPWKSIGHLSYAASSSVRHFVAIGKFKLELQSGNAQLTIFLAAWPWKLTDDLEKQKGTSPKQHEALCIISSPYVNSNWSYGPETAQMGHDFCDLDLWPWDFNSRHCWHHGGWYHASHSSQLNYRWIPRMGQSFYIIFHITNIDIIMYPCLANQAPTALCISDLVL